MNLTEARELALKSQIEIADNGSQLWNMLKTVIFSKIKSAAKEGKFSVVIDLNTVEMAGVDRNISLISTNL